MHLDVSDEIVVIGGGWHAAHELKAFFDRGKRVRYVPAVMNRDAARNWCRRAGIETLDPCGAALETWEGLRRAAPGGRAWRALATGASARHRCGGRGSLVS